MVKARRRSHQSVDWLAYFKSIQSECPWSYAAWCQGLIDVVEYQGEKIPLGHYSARMYVLNVEDSTVEALARALNQDDPEAEWLFSYPGFGPWATPVSVLIQQNRRELNDLRSRLKD